MFKEKDIVNCLVMGEGVVEKIEDDFIVVDFKNNKAKYTKDGRFIVNGTPLNKTLFKSKVILVSGNLVFDINREPINDKDLVLISKNNEFVFEAKFYNSKHNCFYNKDGCIDKNDSLNNISSNNVMCIVKNVPDYILDLKNKLKEDVVDINIDKHNKEVEDVKVSDTGDYFNDNEIKKEAEESEYKLNDKKEEYSTPIYLKGGEVHDVSDKSIVKITDDYVQFKNIEVTGVATFKISNYNVDTFVSISGRGDSIYKNSISKTNPKDYIRIFDSYIVMKNKNGETEYNDIPNENISIYFDENDNKIVIELV